MIDRFKTAIFEPGMFKSTFVGVGGYTTGVWCSVKPILEAAILIATFILLLIHLSNAIVRQWCPVRRQKLPNCEKCKLKGTIFCSRCVSEKDE